MIPAGTAGRGVSRVAGLAVYHHVPREQSAGRRILLVHGALDRAAGFGRVVHHLPGRAVLRYDRRGYGRSAGAGVAPTIAAHIEDLLAILGDESAVVVGHSLGGLIALGAARSRPDLVRAVGAFETPLPWEPWWPGATASAAARQPGIDPEDAAERFLRHMIGDARWQALPERIRTLRRAEGPALVAEIRAARAGGVFVAAELEVPVVAGYGTVSAAHHQRAAKELHAAVRRGELVVIEGADHGAQLSHPAAFADFVERTVALAGPAELGSARHEPG